MFLREKILQVNDAGQEFEGNTISVFRARARFYITTVLGISQGEFWGNLLSVI